MFEDHGWPGRSSPEDRTDVITVVLAALDHQPADLPLLGQVHQRGEALFPCGELGDAVPPPAPHDGDPNGEGGEGGEQLTAALTRLPVEVDPAVSHHEALDLRPHCGEIGGGDEDATQVVALAADRLVDERVGRREPPAHEGSAFSISPRPTATA